MKRVLAASVYPVQAAATRLRLAPVVHALERAGVSAHVSTFLGDNDLHSWLSGGRSRIGPGIRGSARIPTIIREVSSCDLLLLQREVLPLNTLFIERDAVNRCTPIIWDVDDAVWARHPSIESRMRGDAGKYRWLAQHATEVWAGNQHVAAWAEEAGARQVLWVPTTVPVPDSVSDDDREDDLLAWVGTPSTGPFIEALLRDLSDSLGGWRVLVVGARITATASIEVTQMPWSARAEAEVLRRAAVGLYPLDVTHPTTMGKSALKSVLYMAHGIPVVATPTQSNRDVMAHGREGFFASTRSEWREALAALSDQGLRHSMGAAGHAHAARNFDMHKWGEQLAARIMARVGATSTTENLLSSQTETRE